MDLIIVVLLILACMVFVPGANQLVLALLGITYTCFRTAWAILNIMT